MTARITRIVRASQPILRAIWSVVLVIITPLLEKNPVKAAMARSLNLPLVLSMTRLIVLGFAVALLRQICLVGVAGWPDATLAIAVVLAMPTLSAMERVGPEQVVELAKTLMTRFGVGDARADGSVYSASGTGPSKDDGHRADSGGAG